MHNEMLQVEGKKMSKSLGNFFTVRDLLEQGVPGEVIRFVMLSTHYRKPMDWTEKKRAEAEATLRKWADLIVGIDAQPRPPIQVVQALRDDLNTPLALKEMHQLAKVGNGPALRSALDLVGLGSISRDSLSIFVENMKHGVPAIDDYINSMEAARNEKNWAESDRIRDALIDAGVEIKMTQDGISYSIKPHFDPAKLDALK